MKTKILVALLTLASCGQQPATNPEDTKLKGGEVENPKDKKEVVVEYRKDGTHYALAVEDTKDMPACNKDNSKKLVYVKNQNKMFSCEQDQWEEINLKGDKGEQGPPGPQGPAAAPIPVNQFYDAVTKKYWLIGGSANYYTVATYQPACTGAWRLPTRAEAIDAALHGLGTAAAGVSGPADMWTSEIDSAYGNGNQAAYTVRISPSVQEASKLMSEAHGAYCIQK